MRKFNLIFVTFLIVLCFTISCSDQGDQDGEINPQNKVLVGTKWTLTDWDYSLGDDYIGIHKTNVDIFFYSDTEGLIYHRNKDDYSDIGSSNNRWVSHFYFNVSNNTVSIDYIHDENSSYDWVGDLILEGDKLTTNGYVFKKSLISADDKIWLNTLHGKTGDCSWYYDLSNTIYIVGDGEMADYNSPGYTPWAQKAFNRLIVSEGVTSIGNNAFAYESLADVSLPYYSLADIGDNAFSGACISQIRLCNSIKEIGDYAFSGCTYLTKVYFPDNLEIIGDWAFSNCKSISLIGTKKLRKIGKFAFLSTQVTSFTDSNILEEVGAGAFSNLSIKELVLPNSLRKVDPQAFSGNFSEIRIGTGFKEVAGTIFYPASKGVIYVNLGNPIPIDCNIIEEPYTWTLYVPKGSKNAYSQAPYWKNFKNIIEDENLISGNGAPSEDDDENNDNWDNITIPKTYSNAGKTYQWIRVESSTMPTFYIMQTELNASSHFRIDDDIDIGILNSNGDEGITKGEFRSFLEKIKEKTGIQMRLPTREEWVYAAKGGNKSKGYIYSGSNSIDDVAWYKDNSHNSVQIFAWKQPNELGLYDMSGNYGEVTNDNMGDPPAVDGDIYGGCFSDNESSCKVTSYKKGSTSGLLPDSHLKELNAFDARKATVRLVFTAPY